MASSRRPLTRTTVCSEQGNHQSARQMFACCKHRMCANDGRRWTAWRHFVHYQQRHTPAISSWADAVEWDEAYFSTEVGCTSGWLLLPLGRAGGAGQHESLSIRENVAQWTNWCCKLNRHHHHHSQCADDRDDDAYMQRREGSWTKTAPHCWPIIC